MVWISHLVIVSDVYVDDTIALAPIKAALTFGYGGLDIIENVRDSPRGAAAGILENGYCLLIANLYV